MKQLFTITLLLLVTTITKAQSITGSLTEQQGQIITLTGFNYYESFEFSKTTIDSLGSFTLNYPKDYRGMGVLKTQDNSSLVLILTEPNVQLKGVHLQDVNSLSFTNSVANTNFVNYAKTQGLQRNAISALKYLDNLYLSEELFSERKDIKKVIKKEIEYINKQDADFIANLESQSYLPFFIRYKKLVQDMPSIVRNETERIPEAIKEFRTTDFNDPNFKSSGLFKELIEGHYLLLENMGQPLDSVYTQMNVSTQYLIDNLEGNDSLLNTVSNKLFDYFETRSLFKVSEYLALKLLTQNSCVLDPGLSSQLETYRAMKIGNIAKDIRFEGITKMVDDEQNVSSVSEIQTEYKLVVFGASWCPKCTEELPEITKHYQSWKVKGVETIFISIDENKTDFLNFVESFPGYAMCDLKSWETQAANDYYVFSTPTMFLLDKNNKILLRPHSVAQVDAWVNWYIK